MSASVAARGGTIDGWVLRSGFASQSAGSHTVTHRMQVFVGDNASDAGGPAFQNIRLTVSFYLIELMFALVYIKAVSVHFKEHYSRSLRAITSVTIVKSQGTTIAQLKFENVASLMTKSPCV